MRVLLLEDDYLLCKHIKRFLELKGYEVDAYNDGEELLDHADLYEYDIFVFDINVPHINGFEIVEYIKDKEIETPVIFISALVGIEDIKKAFKLGASDYLKKPFELAELELRMQNILSRIEKKRGVEIDEELYYDMDKRMLFRNGEHVPLSKKQNDILYILLKNRGSVVTFEKITDFVYRDEPVEYRTISSHIRDIRKKIGKNFIQNIRGVGYMIK
jgi:DNA-binding response OmpR family regulator